MPSERYWSSSSVALSTSNAWYVYFNGGHVDPNDKSNPTHANRMPTWLPVNELFAMTLWPT
jgi:hypothetical protein